MGRAVGRCACKVCCAPMMSFQAVQGLSEGGSYFKSKPPLAQRALIWALRPPPPPTHAQILCHAPQYQCSSDLGLASPPPPTHAQILCRAPQHQRRAGGVHPARSRGGVGRGRPHPQQCCRCCARLRLRLACLRVQVHS